MQLIRILTLPILPFYAFIVGLRNWSYNKEIIKSNSFDFPIITVGNLSVGGTGKTPQTEYLIKCLQKEFKVGVLSRGYRRRTKGYLEVMTDMNANSTGDEPLQIKRKFPEAIMCVDEERLNGITSMLIAHPVLDVIVLDDAFQHRAVKAGINILLTTFDEPFFKDRLLPIGDLREFKSGKKRADIIVVTKCPENLNAETQEKYIKAIDATKDQKVFFSNIKYGAFKHVFNQSIIQPQGKVLLVTGIAKPKPMLDHLFKLGLEVEHIEFRDHHRFSKNDIDKIKDIFDNFGADSIITTEKDAVRLYDFKTIIESYELPFIYLEIESQFINDKLVFENTISTYVRANKDNHGIPETENHR